MKIKTLLTMIPAALLAIACGKTPSEPTPVEPQKPQETAKIPINISTAVTKVTDTAFETGDAVGLFVVNQPGSLKQNGNHADNVKFTYDGSKWSAENQLYWADDTTPADFYVYYPYSSSANVSAYDFSVRQDQSTEDGYKASEFLVGGKKDVSPTPAPVVINTKHVMSCMVIELKTGTGWTDTDISSAIVTITGLQTAATVNLADGSVSANGGVADIKPLSLGSGAYRALVVPQSVSDADLVKIKVGENEYTLNTSVELVGGKQHKCTIVVNRTSEGINIGVDPWEDGEAYGGTVE